MRSCCLGGIDVCMTDGWMYGWMRRQDQGSQRRLLLPGAHSVLGPIKPNGMCTTRAHSALFTQTQLSAPAAAAGARLLPRPRCRRLSTRSGAHAPHFAAGPLLVARFWWGGSTQQAAAGAPRRRCKCKCALTLPHQPLAASWAGGAVRAAAVAAAMLPFHCSADRPSMTDRDTPMRTLLRGLRRAAQAFRFYGNSGSFARARPPRPPFLRAARPSGCMRLLGCAPRRKQDSTELAKAASLIGWEASGHAPYLV
ncbi:MAG: hypothetical protein J3K34DRAFT_414028 [Monoraphidium minutum]|nr:MAG: hypothetical protein J3K34DRAFT_414028 [Monoraphidium minutum]